MATGIALKAQYVVNDTYNYLWIKYAGIADNAMVLTSNFQNDAASKQHATPFQTIWLRNIGRLVKAAKVDAKEYAFVDVGCGKGVSTLYAAWKYDFKEVEGFDFEPSLIASAVRNKVVSKVDRDVRFFVGDASTYTLNDRKNFVFIFNSFDEHVMEQFLRNNVATFRKNASIVAYANYHHLDVVESFRPKKVVNIRRYRCAVAFF